MEGRNNGNRRGEKVDEVHWRYSVEITRYPFNSNRSLFFLLENTLLTY